MSYGNPGGGDPLPDWPQTAIAAIASAMYINTGNELEPITGVYRPEGQAVVILAALARAGFDVRSTLVTPEAVAEFFHSEYERMAPAFNYSTREASAVPWASVPEDNRRLMQAVAASVMLRFFPQHIAIAHDPEMHQHTSVCGEWCGR